MAVTLKRSPKELRDHLVLESPQLANVGFKFPMMRELIQRWCQSRRVFFPQKPPMEVAAVSTAARDSDVTVSAVGWHGSWHEKGHGKEKSREKRKEKRKGKRQGKERQGERRRERQGKEQQQERTGKLVARASRSEVDGTVPWLLWSLLEMGSQEGPVPSMAEASSDGTRCNGVTSFTDCCF